MKVNAIIIYTDGSCNPRHGVGAWASLLFIDQSKVVLTGAEEQTTHQRMELQAVIKSFEYLAQANLLSRVVELYTDSQYVTGLSGRKIKLKASGFMTKKNVPIRNSDLVRILIEYSERMHVHFIKVKAHQKNTEQNSNREVDLLARKIVRERINSRHK
jgi:ribonuclease HI